MDIIKYIKDPSWWAVVIVLLLILWTQRDKLIALVSKKIESNFAREANESQYSRTLVERLIDTLKQQRADYDQMLNMERIERKQALYQVLNQTESTQKMITETIDVMRGFVDVARATVDRQGELDRELLPILQEMEKTLNAVGYVLAQLYFRDHGKTFKDLVDEIDRNDGASG